MGMDGISVSYEGCRNLSSPSITNLRMCLHLHHSEDGIWDWTNFSKHKNHSMKHFKHLTSRVFPQIYFCLQKYPNKSEYVISILLKWRNRRASSRGQAEAVSSDKWDGVVGHPLFLGSCPGMKRWSGAVWLIQLLLGWLLWPGDNGFIKLSPSPPRT